MAFFRKIPLSIHPFFWVLAGIIGYLSSGTLSGMLIWIGIIFVSVVVHEMGHALTACVFGLHPQIQLIAVGGVTSYEAKHLSYWKQFLIVLNGPVFGFLLFVVATVILYVGLFSSPMVISVLRTFQIVNLFWTIVNLVPVLPLDGGQLLRIVMEGFFGLKGLKISFFVGMLIALAISLYFFLMRGFLIGVLFFLFAFQSFDAWRKSKFMTLSDRNEDNAAKMQEAEKALKEGRKQEAQDILLQLRDSTKKGLIYVSATHYLALIYYEQQKRHEAYELLLSIKDQLTNEALVMMHELAFEEHNYELVAKISASVFQMEQTQEVAIRNAKAFAYLNQAKPSGGWLQTAAKIHHIDREKIIQDSAFDTVRDQKEFLQFLS